MESQPTFTSEGYTRGDEATGVSFSSESPPLVGSKKTESDYEGTVFLPLLKNVELLPSSDQSKETTTSTLTPMSKNKNKKRTPQTDHISPITD